MDRVHALPHLHERRERVFLVLAGVFLGCMTMLNIVGITRFVHIGPLALAVGVLPYPLTFLCTDFISEFYGRRRANFVVWVGFLLNILVITFLWFGHQLPGLSEAARPQWLPEGSWQPPPWQTLHFASPTQMPSGPGRGRVTMADEHGTGHETRDVRFRPVVLAGLGLIASTIGAVLLMQVMLAYLAAREAKTGGPVSPLAGAYGRQAPPEPRLQTDPVGDLAALRAREDVLLQHYTWVDEDAGVMRIPIERAMELLADGGPAR